MRGVEGEGGVGGAMILLFSLQCTAASDIDLDDILKNFEGIFCGRLVHMGFYGWMEGGGEEEGGRGKRNTMGKGEQERR